MAVLTLGWGKICAWGLLACIASLYQCGPCLAFLRCRDLLILAAMYAGYTLVLAPGEIKSMPSYNNKSERFLKKRREAFPAPYPNGWYRVCSSIDLLDENIHSIAALGRDFVAFRGHDGNSILLDALWLSLTIPVRQGRRATRLLPPHGSASGPGWPAG
jgi:hypothetical protein